MTGTIPFARDSWVAVNLYSMRTDGHQTLTLDGKPPPNYSPDETVAYLNKYEAGPHELGLGGTFYCIKTNEPPPPDLVSAMLEALTARGRGRWLRVVREPVREHTLQLWDAEGRLLDDQRPRCTCGGGIAADPVSVLCWSGAEIFEAT